MGTSGGVGLACAFLDRDGELADGLDALARPPWDRVFTHVGMSVPDGTHARTQAALDAVGAHVRVAARAYEQVGRERRFSLGIARSAGADVVVAGDVDHVLRWLRAAPGEVHGALDRFRADDLDCLVVGRPAAAFAGFPAALGRTEPLVNRAYERLTGHAWDLLSSVRVLSARAADLIVERSTVDTVATDVDWPLLCASAGLRVGYVEAAHLTYVEGNALDDRDGGADEDAGPDPGDARAWLLRLRVCGWMSDAMAAYLP
jgi:hypothetical protein